MLTLFYFYLKTVGYAKQMNAQGGGPPSSSVSPKIKPNMV
jgi:hypothetical protein